MEQYSPKRLRNLAVTHGVNINGLYEKSDIAQHLRAELAKKFCIAEEKVNEHLAQAEEKVDEHLAQASKSALAVQQRGVGSLGVDSRFGAAAGAVAGAAADSEVDYVRTADLVQHLSQTLASGGVRQQQQHQQQGHRQLQQQHALLNVWFELPDGVGRFCFTEPGELGLPLFYPFMARSGVALAFECRRCSPPPVRCSPCSPPPVRCSSCANAEFGRGKTPWNSTALSGCVLWL